MSDKIEQKREYATTAFDDGVNYRDIAETMTEIGFSMNHSSARNYVIRIMKKFADAYVDEYDVSVDDDRLTKIAKSPSFQSGVSDLLHAVEARRRAAQS